MLADALPPEYPPTTSLIHRYVPDCDAAYAQAMAAGATSIAEPADQFYGDRLARITDPHGNQWSISTHIEDLTPNQIAALIATLGEGLTTKDRRQRCHCRLQASQRQYALGWHLNSIIRLPEILALVTFLVCIVANFA